MPTAVSGKRKIASTLALIVLPALMFVSGCVISGCDRTTAPPGSETSKLGKDDEPARSRKKIRKSGSAKTLLKKVRFWAYQIQNQNENGNIKKLAASHYDLLVIDQTRSLKGDENYDSKADVSILKNSPNSRRLSDERKLVVCYLDVGEAESYRWYWKQEWKVGAPEWIVAKDPGGWDENYPVKFWRDEWKSIMKQNLDRIIDDGYDGIYLDWLEVYSFEPVAGAAASEGLDARIELTNFVAELSQYAHSKKPDFLFIAQNAAELETFPDYTKLFNAIAQEAVWYDGTGDPDSGEYPGDEPVDVDESDELVELLKKWQKLGKPVLNVEYAGEDANIKDAYLQGGKNGFKTYVTLRALDKLTSTPPPRY